MSFGNPRCAITPGQLAIIAKIADESITTYKQRKDSSRKYFIALVRAEEKKGEASEFDLKEAQEMQAEIDAERKGGKER